MSVNSPKISVIMPVYNAEAYLQEAIESILNQTFKDFEFIIVNDCSSDLSWNIIQQYFKRDKRIIVIRNEKKLGVGRSRNKGFSFAKGKYIAFSDADDISLPDRLEKQCKFMEENTEVGIVGGYLQFFDGKRNLNIRKYALDDKSLRRTIFRYSPVSHPGAMVRKKCFDEFGGYSSKYLPAEDLDMSFRIGYKYKFANLQQVVIKYREHVDSLTFKNFKMMCLNTLEIRKKYAKDYRYNMTTVDKIYNLLQYCLDYIIPSSKIKICLFNMIRNSKEK